MANLIKRIIYAILGLITACSGMIVGMTTVAQSDFSDIEKLLNEDNGERGYGTSDIVKLKSTTSTSVTLESPAIKKDGKAVTGYEITYATKPIGSAVAADVSSKKILVSSTGTTVTLTIEGLQPNTTYYFAIEPVDGNNQTGLPSDEITAKTATQGQDPQPENIVLNAAAPTFSCEINNISYSQDGNTVTMTRTATLGDVLIDTFLRYGNDKTNTKIGDGINGTDGRFSFVVSKVGTYYVTFIPKNSAGNSTCKEKVQTIKIDKITQSDLSGPITPTGPMSTLMLAFFATLITYSGFKYITTKK